MLATVAASLLRGGAVTDELDADLGAASPTCSASPTLDRSRRRGGAPVPDARRIPLESTTGSVGTLSTPRRRPGGCRASRAASIPALASLLAVAIDRERAAARGARGGDAPAQRRGQDRGAPGRLARPPLAAHGDRRRRERARQPRSSRSTATIARRWSRRSRSSRRDSTGWSRDLLDLSRLQAGAAEPQRELWSVDELVGARARRARATRRDRGRRSPTTSLRSQVDAAQIRRVLVNVLENALRHRRAGGRVRVTGAADGETVVLRIADDGPGIDRPPSSSGCSSRSSAGQRHGRIGHGPRARDRAGLRRGERRPLRAEAADRGNARVRPSAARPNGASMTGARILVVDDEPQILRALQTNLRGAGYEVTTATTAERGARRGRDASAGRDHPRPRPARRQRYRRLPGAAHLDDGAGDRPLGGRRREREGGRPRRRRGRLRDEAVRDRRAARAPARVAAPCRRSPASR